jgi:hypothetical protein
MHVFGFLDRLWHQHAKGHVITYHGATMPDAVIRSRETGKPLINVFEQVEFAVPVAHYECNCGVIWEA